MVSAIALATDDATDPTQGDRLFELVDGRDPNLKHQRRGAAASGRRIRRRSSRCLYGRCCRVVGALVVDLRARGGEGVLMGGLQRGVLAFAVLVAVLAGRLCHRLPLRTIAPQVPSRRRQEEAEEAAACLQVADDRRGSPQALGTAPTSRRRPTPRTSATILSPANYNFIQSQLASLGQRSLWKQSAQGINVTIPWRNRDEGPPQRATTRPSWSARASRHCAFDQYVAGPRRNRAGESGEGRNRTVVILRFCQADRVRRVAACQHG